MKNIQVIDGAENCIYDIFAATEDEFERIWQRRIKKRDAQGIQGTLFYDLGKKKKYYPTRKDEEAVNPDGTRLR